MFKDCITKKLFYTKFLATLLVTKDLAISLWTCPYIVLVWVISLMYLIGSSYLFSRVEWEKLCVSFVLIKKIISFIFYLFIKK